MKIESLIWLDEIIEKLWVKHHVEAEDVREILEGRPLFRFVEKGHRKGENVYAALGQTEAGRYLVVFFVLKRDRQALVISARDMTGAERRHYDQRR